MTFQTIGTFLLVFVRLTLGKVGLDGVEKVTPDINFILSPYYRSYSADRDFLYESLSNSRLLWAMT